MRSRTNPNVILGSIAEYDLLPGTSGHNVSTALYKLGAACDRWLKRRNADLGLPAFKFGRVKPEVTSKSPRPPKPKVVATPKPKPEPKPKKPKLSVEELAANHKIAMEKYRERVRQEQASGIRPKVKDLRRRKKKPYSELTEHERELRRLQGARWRERNREHYNAYQAEYMAKKKAKSKAA
jgi:hypothetical protein